MIPLLRQRRQNARHRCPNVGTQGQRVHALYSDDSHPDQRRECGGEDGTALKDHGHPRAEQNGQITGEVGRASRQFGVDDLVHELGHRALQKGVQDFDDPVQSQENDEEGTSE